MIKIKVIDSVLCEVENKQYVSRVKPTFAFDYTFWKPEQIKNKEGKPIGKTRRVPTNQVGHFINRQGRFLTGLLPRVLNDHECILDDRIIYPEKENEPGLLGIQFREDQFNLLDKMYEHKRGIIKSPTGSGKTIIAMGFASMFPSAKILFLAHNLDIVTQTHDEFDEKGFNGIRVKEIGPRITISTIQTFKKINENGDYFDYYDIVIIDEAHHCNKRKSLYGKALQLIDAPYKFGFTATLPEGRRKLMAQEGLLGPVIGELTIQEGVELGIMAKPKITLVPLDVNTNLTGLKYKDTYTRCIVKNRLRNRKIAVIVRDRVEAGKTVLIMVKEILHGQNIADVLDIYGVDSYFVKGDVDKETRNEIKKKLNSKKIKCVISTAVWREGVNIPTLDCIINACGGKSEIMTLQAIGRGLRKAEGKDTVEIVDLLDEYRYLAGHAIRRVKIYVENDWL